MVNSINPDRNIVCDHNVHLFSDPLCKEQSLFKRIGNVMFHVLTLGIPLAVYKLMSVCCPNMLGVTNQKSLAYIHNRLEKKTMKHSKNILKSARNTGLLNNVAYKAKSFEPVGNDIIDYIKLTKIYHKNLLDLIKTCDPKTLWQDKRVLSLANDLISLNFTTSILILRDLDAQMAAYPDEEDFNSYESVLTHRGGHVADVFLAFMSDYKKLRCGLRFEDGAFKIDDHQQSLDIKQGKIFYQKGSFQNDWRMLHNIACDRLRTYTSDENLAKQNLLGDKLVKWSQKDESVTTYKPFSRF